MSTAIIYTFSGTGNTARIARLYAEEFEKHDVRCTVFNITANAEPTPATDFDYVGFAYPIHGFNAPEIVLDFAKKVDCKDKEYFILKTSGEPLAVNNSSSNKLKRILKRKGCTFTSEYHYVMPYNMIFRHSDLMASKMWNTAKALCPIEAEEVLNGVKTAPKRIPFGGLISAIVRIEQPAMKVNGRFFKVDEDKCINCGKCVKDCPERNISVKDGKITFGGDCVMCARCSFSCPVDAIKIGILNNWRVNGKYDLENRSDNKKETHTHYCKRSYARYFARAEEKTVAYRANRG